jgi:hypothetical protein
MLPILREGLVLELHFNELSGSAVYDLSGNNYNGTIYGATRVQEGFGRALSFDGVDDYVSLGNVLNMGTSPFSILAWVLSFETGVTKGIVGKKVSFSSIASAGYSLGQASSGMRWGFRVGDGTNGVTAEGPTITIGVWTFLAGTFDTTKTARLYVNGVLTASSQNVNIGSVNTTADFKVGYIDTAWKGIVDEVLIYNRALSESEIRTLYNYYMKKKTIER